jgi:hypothetical protein
MSKNTRTRPSLTRLLWALAVGSAALLAPISLAAPSGGASGRVLTLPEFKNTSPDAWINSPPLTAASLRGKVVLLEVYTSG